VDHDAIVVGGGHNGLICAAYLARAGLDTLVLEARPSVGGCASTVDALGARVNICNCDHGVFRTTPIADELDLAAHGLRYLDVDPAQVSLPWNGGPAWPLFHDVDRTLEAIALTYPQEVDGYRRYVAAARPVAELVVEIANQPPTPGGVLRHVAARRGRGVTTLLQWTRTSAAAVLRRFFTHDALLAPAVVVGPSVWGLSPDMPGTGLGAITYALKHTAQVGRPVGGSGALPAAVLAAFETVGGKIRTGSRVIAIRCEGDRVRGVELADGMAIEARIVVTACDPRTTFVRWLRDPPGRAAETVARWRATPEVDGYESKLDAIVADAPRYRQTDPQVVRRLGYDPLTATTIVAPALDAMAAAHRLMAEGRIVDRPMLFANVPSVLDPSMRVGDAHVLSLEVLYTPYGVAGGWPTSREPERWLECFGGLVQPEFLGGVRAWRAMTPDRYEADFHLPRGHATSFPGGPLAALRGRPPELTRYETPVRGLYLTGAATFPGAGVWGAPGRNAATVILQHDGSRSPNVS
jgi:phytoene dehydrogenase-like protein